MALVVDKTVKYLNVPDANNFTFQCSKPMSQLTADDVKSADFWVGFTSFAHNQMCEGNIESGLPLNDPDHCWCWATDPSALYEGDWSTAHWSFPANYPTGIYMRNILVECAAAHTQNVSLQNNASARIVMNIEAGENTKLQDLFITGSSYVTCPYSNENRVTDYRYIKPAILMIVNSVLYVWIQAFAPYMSGFFCDSSTSQGYRSSQSFDDFMQYGSHNLAMGWTRALETGDMYTDSGSTTSVNFNYTVPDVDFNGVTADLNVSLGSTNYKKRASISITDNEDKEIEKWYTAFTGFKFKVDDVWYKPIVEGGIVTGYTDDMTVTSEWDEWDNITGHNVPVTPPVPPPGPGYDDDPWEGVSFSGVGLGGGGAFARCYYMTSTELANLRSWMCGINVPEGFNPMAQIIGLSQVPVALSGDAPETVQFINSSAVYDPGVTSRIVDSNVSTQYSMGGPIKYSLGSVDIVRRMQERGEPYLDYSCQIELYLPLIGMFSLDTQAVMGRTIEAEAILDPISGTLAAYAWVSKDGQKLPVAYGSTTISVDLPVTAQQYSVSKAALKQANAQLGTSILSSVATLVAAAVGAGKAEGSNARVSGGASSMQGARGMNSYAQASSIAASQAAISQTGNIVGDFMQWGRTIKQLQYGNNTAISGSFGGSVAQWSYPFQAYVKINRPRYEKPENYAHTQGVPCVQKKRIGDCTGFIQCIGVDVDNHIEGATDLERQAIQAALSSGIYAGGGGE
jgi:hypothetical protein